MFNVRYTFTFAGDAVDNLDEPLVHLPTFIRIAKDFGLQFHSEFNLKKYLEQSSAGVNSAGGEIARINRMANYGGATKYSEDVSQFYRAFAFEKTGNSSLTCTQLSQKLKDGLLPNGKVHPIKFL